MECYRVASGALDVVQGEVGGLEQAQAGVDAPGELGRADAQGYRNGQMEISRCEPQPFTECGRHLARGVGEDQGELVAADATDDVAGAAGVAQGRREAAQYLVADEVTVAVVDLLEVVDIDEQYAQSAFKAMRVVHLVGQSAVERAA